MSAARLPVWVALLLGVVVLGLSIALGLVASSSAPPSRQVVRVPRLVGLPTSVAFEEAQGMGLVLRFQRITTCERHGQSPGWVLSQSPPPNTTLPRGSRVVATWSTAVCH